MAQVSKVNLEDQPVVNFIAQPQEIPEQPAKAPVTSQPELTKSQTKKTENSSTTYASFLDRFIAVLIDSIILGISISFISRIFGFSSSNGSFYFHFSPSNILIWIYYVFMTYKYGATLGKMAMHIRVQTEDTGENLTVGMAALREVIGKIISAFVLLLGYLWMLWDPKKQTWHDKIARSVVVKVN